MSSDNSPSRWDENTSKQFLDYGKYYIPAREQQMRVMLDVLQGVPRLGQVLELCCGEGLLAELILNAYPDVNYAGLDGSPLMLEKAAHRLSRFGGRFSLADFDLAELSWRRRDTLVDGVVSSLAIHHLDGEEKQGLFKDVHGMLSVGGVFIISDMVDPVTDAGRAVAANAWDDVVRKRSIELDGSPAGLDFFTDAHWNTYRYPDPDDIDHPSPLFDQLRWLAQAGFINIDVHFFEAGHALFSGWKSLINIQKSTES